MTLQFDAATHRYFLDGPEVLGVTRVLWDGGAIRLSGPEAVMAAARWRGTIVHQAVAAINDGAHLRPTGDLDVDAFRADFPDFLPYVEAWLEFRAQRQFTSLLNEHRVASRRYQVAGTLDCLGELDGVGVLLDFATGDPADVSKDLQTAAYLGLALEWAQEPDSDPALRAFFDGRRFVHRYAVQLKKTGRFTLHAYRDPADFRKFLTLVAAQRIVAARRSPARMA